MPEASDSLPRRIVFRADGTDQVQSDYVPDFPPTKQTRTSCARSKRLPVTATTPYRPPPDIFCFFVIRLPPNVVAAYGAKKVWKQRTTSWFKSWGDGLKRSPILDANRSMVRS